MDLFSCRNTSTAFPLANKLVEARLTFRLLVSPRTHWALVSSFHVKHLAFPIVSFLASLAFPLLFLPLAYRVPIPFFPQWSFSLLSLTGFLGHTWWLLVATRLNSITVVDVLKCEVKVPAGPWAPGAWRGDSFLVLSSSILLCAWITPVCASTRLGSFLFSLHALYGHCHWMSGPHR